MATIEPLTVTARVQVGRTGVLPGRPLFTIATITTTAALILTAIATAGLAVAGALPADFADQAPQIVKWSALAGALSLGLGGLGKSIYAIAAAVDRGNPLPTIQSVELPEPSRRADEGRAALE